MQTVNSIVVEIQSSEGGGVLEGVGSDLADVVVVQFEMDQPLQIIENSIVNHTDVIEADINGLECFKSIETVPGQVLQEVDLAWSSFRTNRENRLTYQDYVQAAKDTETLYSDQFSVNRRTLLDLLDRHYTFVIRF